MTKKPPRGEVTKRKLTPNQAAQQLKDAKRITAEQKPLIEEATEILKAHFEKTDTKVYKGLELVTNASKKILDQPKVRSFLGKRLPEFQKDTEESTSIVILKP